MTLTINGVAIEEHAIPVAPADGRLGHRAHPARFASCRACTVSMDYLTIKSIHVGASVLSYTFFFARGVWMLRSSQLLAHLIVKIASHVVDTVLLGSAIALAVLSRHYPLRRRGSRQRCSGLSFTSCSEALRSSAAGRGRHASRRDSALKRYSSTSCRSR